MWKEAEVGAEIEEEAETAAEAGAEAGEGTVTVVGIEAGAGAGAEAGIGRWRGAGAGVVVLSMIAEVNHMDGMIEDLGLEYHLEPVEILQWGSAGEGASAGSFILITSIRWMGTVQKMNWLKG